MAELPPKIPTICPPAFSHHKNFPMGGGGNPSWVDEFLDFSSAKRGAHRRSISDSIAFMEVPASAAAEGHSARHEFERFDDEQFLTMFADGMMPAPPASSSNPSTPSEEEEKTATQPLGRRPKNEAEEVESSCKSEGQTDHPPSVIAAPTERIADPKRVKRYYLSMQNYINLSLKWT